MAKVIVPIAYLEYADDLTFDNEVMDAFFDAGIWVDDDDTAIGRVRLDLTTDAGKGVRLATIQRIRNILGADQAERLIALLDNNDWDVRFFVDCW